MKKITTPLTKTVIEVKDWITGRESQALQRIYNEGIEEKNSDMKRTDPELSINIQNKKIELVAISFNEDKTDVVNKILELPKKDFTLICDEIELIINPIDEESKKKLTDK